MKEIAVINGETITEDIFNKFYQRILLSLEEDENFELTKENEKFIKVEALQNLIESIIILQEAKKLGITVDDDVVIKKVNEIKSSSDEEELKKDLKKIGLDEQGLFEEIKKEEIIEKFFLEAGVENISFTEEELKSFYESNKDFIKEPDILTLFEIFVENEDKASSLIEWLKSTSSREDIENKLKKEEYDYFFHDRIQSGNLPIELNEAIEHNEFIDNIYSLKNEFGFFVYKLIEIKKGKKLEYSEVKKSLAEFLITEAIKENRAKIIESLLEKADIKYLDTSIFEE